MEKRSTQKSISLWIPGRVNDRVNAEAARLDKSRSHILRVALSVGLAHIEADEIQFAQGENGAAS
jgi:hypothetical protein